MLMEQTMRWYGPSDPVSLSDILQSGASGVVSALHHIAYGEVWTVDEIAHRKRVIEEAGLRWSVVESVPVHEDIKTRTGRYEEYIENYKQTLRNLGAYGINRVVYNFMPVLDWIRTDLWYRLPNGVHTIRFDSAMFAAFELYILGRSEAQDEYTPDQLAKAETFYKSLTRDELKQFELSIIDNLPGCDRGKTTIHDIRSMLAKYKQIDRAKLKEHLKLFLQAVVPVAEAAGVTLMIHPDDPPFHVLGLPRIMSVQEDIDDLLAMVDSPSNGVNFCAGSFSGRPDNDIVAMFKSCAHRVKFMHLRSTQHEEDGSFYEAEHLKGGVDMFGLVKALVEEQIRRRQAGQADFRIAIRPDHGHTMLDDILKRVNPNPGYSCIGRLKGLAELRGLEMGIVKALYPEQAEGL